MDIYTIICGIFAGNIMTLAMVWGFIRLEKRAEVDPFWLPWFAIAVPVAVFLLGALSTAG